METKSVKKRIYFGLEGEMQTSYKDDTVLFCF